MLQTILAIVGQVTAVTLTAVQNILILAAVFTIIAKLCEKGTATAPWWRKPDLSTDICFALFPRLVVMYGQMTLLVIGVALLHGIHGPNSTANFLDHGVGLFARCPVWQQIIIYLLGGDLVMYVTHRIFHTARFWRFHAVHHSSEQLEWISSYRFHPVEQVFHGSFADVVMLLLGIPPDVLVWLTPWNVGSAALVHANLNWDFGRFRYVLVSPVFHRWHHTALDQGGNSNFAGTFPIFDLLFGTFFMPKGVYPDHFGIDEHDYPRDFIGLMAAPFRRNGGAVGQAGLNPAPPDPAAALRPVP